jgi:DNA-3-methyladenine glycosylase
MHAPTVLYLEPPLTSDPHLLGDIQLLDRLLLEGHASDAARSLLGRLLVRDLHGMKVVARIVETEAYREDDPASHTYGRRTARVEPMFGPPGTAYVYRSYGVHWCLNVAVEGAGIGAAVLLRAAVVLEGHESVRARRPTARADRDLLRGPGNLCRGLEIDAPNHDGVDLLASGAGLHLADDGWRPAPDRIVAGPRVGVRLASDVPWRFHLADTDAVSRYVRSPRAPPAP